MYQKNNRPYQTQQGITKTRGIQTDRERRGRIGTSNQPFNAPIATPNILDYEAILMRNAENDRRVASRRRIEIRERYQSTLQDIGAGTPREDREQDEEKDEEIVDEVKPLEQQIVSVKQLIGSDEEAINQGQLTQDNQRAQIDDQPQRIRRGPTTLAERQIIDRRREYFHERGMTREAELPAMQVLSFPPPRS